MSGTARLIIAALLIEGAALASPARAQSAAEQEQEQVVGRQPATLAQEERPYLWNIGVSVGNISGAATTGAVETDSFILSFKSGSKALVSARVARRLWWRLGGEVEFGRASPGVIARQTDLEGAGLVEFDFADFTMSYVAASARIDLTDAFITPFLIAGPAVVFADTDGDSSVGAGFLFGGGIDVRLYQTVFLRADVKGLRSRVDAVGLDNVEEFTGVAIDEPPISTQVLWSLGIAVRF